MSDKATKEEILELIQWIDSHESSLFRPYDFFSGWGRTLALLFVLLFIIAEIMNFVTASATERISISLTSVAVFIAFISIVIQTGESNIVEGRFKKALKSRTFDDKQKLLVKALIKIKSKNDEFKLGLIYERNKAANGDMFTEKRLLEKLYE
jgi:hypothetical protein